MDHEADDAEQTLQSAKAVDPELDDSVYRAYALLQRGLPEQGRECLSPVDSGMKLDAYFSCMIAQKAGLPEFEAVLQATGISPNWQSLRLLAIAALQSGCFEEAHHYVQEAREKGHADPHLPIVEALIFYWKALYRTYPDVDRTGFAIADNPRFVPGSGQTRSLEQSYQILDELYERNVQFGDSGTRSLLAWALLAVSVALPGKDYLHWLKEFQALRPLDPMDIIFCTNKGIPLSEEICEEFLALPIPEQNTGSHAYARYRLLDALGRHDEARETFSANLAEIASYYGCSSDLCQLQMLIDTKNCHEATKLLEKIQLSGEEKKRFEIAIQFQLAPKAYNQLVKQVVDFARTTRKGIDYGNAMTVCRFYKKWDAASSTAKEWWDTTSELAALEAYAEALLKKGKYSKCLRSIKKAEDDSLALKQAILLLVKVLQIPSERMLEFSDWSDPYLIASWWANPTFVPKAAKQISKFIQTTLLDGPYTSNEKKVAVEKLSIAYICNIPYLIRPFVIRELINHPFWARFDFDEMIQEDEWKISQLGNIQEGIEGSFILDKARILCGDEDAMDAAACFVLANVQAHSEGFVQEFPIDSMSEVPAQANYTLARFLANLSWYFPPSMRAHLHELKRKLSAAPALEY